MLANDTDLDGDPLTATLVSGPTQAASFVLNKDGTFIYTPTANYNGSDAFTYEVSDSNGGTAQATATITISPVNDAPVADDDFYSINEDASLVEPADGVLLNDADVDGDSITAVLVSGPSHAASFTLNADGSFSYTPEANWNGSDSFTYQANDGSVGSNVATVTITVNAVNDAPVLLTGSVNNLTVNEYAGLTSLVLGSVTYGPNGGSDETGQTLTYTVTVIPDPINFGKIYLADNTTQVTTGSYTLTEIQGMQFEPNPNENGISFFSFNVQDDGGTGNGGSDTLGQSIMITVNPVNDMPTTSGIADVTVDEDASDTVIDLFAAFADVEDPIRP